MSKVGNPLPFPSVGRTVKVAVAINVVEGSTMNFSPLLLAKFLSSSSGYLKRPNKFHYKSSETGITLQIICRFFTNLNKNAYFLFIDQT